MRGRELGEHLPAAAARQQRRESVVARDRDRAERAGTAERGREDGGALGAHGEPEARVLDVGARDDAAVLETQRGAHGELRVRRVRVLAGLAGRVVQRDLVGVSRVVARKAV